MTSEGIGPWAAVLWDLDGTLIDTEDYWHAAEVRLAESFGRTWSAALAQQLVGSDLMDSAHFIRRELEIDLSAEEVVRIMVDDVLAQLSQEVRWRPGAVDRLLGLSESGVPLALVTMSYRRLLDPFLAELPEGTFQVIVSGDVARRGKPHPDPYLQAAAGLGVDPRDCLAVEDSETGARSAEAAGCAVLAIPHHVSVADGPRRTIAALLTDPVATEMFERVNLRRLGAVGRSTTGQ